MEKINGLPKNKVLQKLKDDNDYYGEFGKTFLSNSNIRLIVLGFNCPFLEYIL